MEIHVHDGEKQLGPFPASAVVEMARIGTLPASATVWHTGAADWYPLAEFLTQQPTATLEVPARDAPRPSAGELRALVIARERAQLDELSAQGQRNLFRALGAGFGVALLGAVLWWLQGRATKGLLIPGPGVLIGMGVGAVIGKFGKGEGSALLPAAAVIFTLGAHLIVGVSLNSLTLFLLPMALFMAWKLSYLYPGGSASRTPQSANVPQSSTGGLQGIRAKPAMLGPK